MGVKLLFKYILIYFWFFKFYNVNSCRIFESSNKQKYILFQVRIFHFLTGKLHKVLDESLQRFQELQHQTQQLPNMEFGRR